MEDNTKSILKTVCAIAFVLGSLYIIFNTNNISTTLDNTSNALDRMDSDLNKVIIEFDSTNNCILEELDKQNIMYKKLLDAPYKNK